MKIRKFNENINNEAMYILESLEDFLTDVEIKEMYFGENQFGVTKNEYSRLNNKMRANFTKTGYQLEGTISLMDTLYYSSSSQLDYDEALTNINDLKSMIEFLKIKSDELKGKYEIITKYYNGPDQIIITIIDLNSNI